MICEKCGTEAPDGRAFCGRCGNKLEPTPKLKKASPFPAIFAVIVVAAVTVLVLALSGLDFTPFGKTCDELTREYMTSQYGGDRENILELQHDAVVQGYLEETGMTEHEYRTQLSGDSDRIIAYYNALCGSGWEMSYKVADQWNKTGDALEQFQNEFEDLYDLPVDAVKNVELDVTISGTKSTTTFRVTVVLVKINMFWYIA